MASHQPQRPSQEGESPDHNSHSPEPETLAARIRSVRDPKVLKGIHELLEQRGDANAAKANSSSNDENPYEAKIREVLAEYDKQEDQLEHTRRLPVRNALERLEQRWAPLAFRNAVLALVLFGLLLSFNWEEESRLREMIAGGVYAGYAVCAGFQLLECLLLWRRSRKSKIPLHPRRMARRALCVLLPPLRMGMHRYSRPGWIWIPVYGWSRTNRALFDKLQADFSTPMIVLALLIIPLLIIEWQLSDFEMVRNTGIDFPFWLNIAGAFIWMGFSFEYILMMGIAEDKFDYFKRHVLDLIIILLPILSLFPAFQVLRATRLGRATRMLRLRGMLLKARQAAILLRGLQRLLYPNPETQLKTLQKKMRENRHERQRLEEQVQDAVARLKEREARKQAGITSSWKRFW